MTVPISYQAWFHALIIERPWDDNETTRRLVERVRDEDLAAVIWALERMNALKWLDLRLKSLNGESPGSLLSTDAGRLRVWALLEAASAWL